MTAKQNPQKQNGIEEKMEEADAKERGPDADMESETQGKLNASGDDHGYLDVCNSPKLKAKMNAKDDSKDYWNSDHWKLQQHKSRSCSSQFLHLRATAKW